MRAEKERPYTVRLDKIVQDAVNFFILVFTFCMLLDLQKCIMIFKKIVFPSIKIFPQIQKSCSPAPLQPLVGKRLTKLPEKGELKLNLWLPRSVRLWVCPLCVLPFTPLTGICEKQRPKDRRIRQCSSKKNAKWDTKVIWQRNPATQVWKETRRTLFAHIQQHLRSMHIHLQYIIQTITALGKVQLSSWVCLCHFLQLQGNCRGGKLICVLLLLFFYLSCSKGWVSPHLWMMSPRRYTSRFKLSINTAVQTDPWESFTEVTWTGR